MIIVTGGTGQVGSSLVRMLIQAGIPCLAPTREEFPLDDSQKILDYLSTNEFTSFVHLSAETNVDYCETNRESATQRNVEAVKIIASYCQDNSKKFIFVSSSAVLSGDGAFMHKEDADYAPANFYGETKMEAERFIVENCIDYLIIRASWMLGVGVNVKKYAQVVYEKILNDENVLAVYDRFGSLTSSFRLAELILNNLEYSHSGIIHCASTTPCSRYEIAKHISVRLKKTSRIDPVSNDHFNLVAPRGFSEGLQSELAAQTYKYLGFKWEEELDDFLERAY